MYANLPSVEAITSCGSGPEGTWATTSRVAGLTMNKAWSDLASASSAVSVSRPHGAPPLGSRKEPQEQTVCISFQPRCPSTRSPVPNGLRLRGLARLRIVEAFAVNRRDLGAHRPQVRRQLSAMVNRMAHAHLQKCHRRKLKQAAEIGDFNKVIAFKLRKLFEIAFVVLRIPGGHLRWSLEVVRQSSSGGKFGLDSGFQEADLGTCNVANQFHGGLGDRIRAVIGLVGRHRFQNLLGGAAFIFHGAKQKILQPEFGQFGSKCASHECLLERTRAVYPFAVAA